MNRKFLLPAIVIVATLAFTSCKRNVLRGEGSITSQNIPVGSFSVVQADVDVNVSITVKEGAVPSVVLNGYANVIKHLKATVEGNRLHITSDLDETWEIECDSITAEVTMPAITGVTLNGSPDADIHGNITGSNFDLQISGAASVSIDNLNVDNFSSHVSGTADIEVKGGSVKKASYALSGTGDIGAFPLQTLETDASISGAGSGEVTASQKLSVSISGAGSIDYKGHPVITKEISGAGSVDDAN